jgi:NAD(P)-dependent dehydrogenase (short-subunit alcohol dehydrogenase family)
MACGIDANANRELQREADSRGYQLNAGLCDVSRPEQVRAMVAKTVAQFGGLDLIANSAAIRPFGAAVETDRFAHPGSNMHRYIFHRDYQRTRWLRDSGRLIR